MIKEQELERLAQCPLLVPTGPSKMETCANALISWALRQSLEGSFTNNGKDLLHQIRGKVLELLDNSHGAGIIARKAAFNLFGLMADYEVLHLEQPYNLTLIGYTIQGKYALLRKRRGLCLPFLLQTHTEEPPLRHNHALPPSFTLMARYVHLVTTTKYQDAQILNYSVLRGKSWVNKHLDVSLAKQYLEGIIKVASLKSQYPKMGEHCNTCTTKPCLGVFNGPNDSTG